MTTSRDARELVERLVVGAAQDLDKPDLERDHHVELLRKAVAKWAGAVAVEDGLQPVEVLWLLESTAQRLGDAVKRVADAIDGEMLDDVLEHGDIRLGEFGYRAAPATERKILDRDAFVAWVGAENLDDVFRLNERNMRITALEALAERRGMDPDTVADTFLEKVDKGIGKQLDRLPASRRKWVEKLKHGERR